MANIETRYEVDFSYIHNNKETKFKQESIKSIIIDNNYLNSNFPVMYVTVNIKSSLYDKMLSNIDNDTVILTIGKYDTNKKVKAVKNYIKQEFTYFFANTNSNYKVELEKKATDKKQDSSEAYRIAHIGLICSSLYNYNKKIYNDVTSGSMQSIVYKYLSDIPKVIIEPFENNKSMSELLIPPIVGLSNLIRYLYDVSSFYKSQFMFFIDLTKTCFLLSCNGKGIKRKSGAYSSVIIDIDSSAEDSKSKTLGLYKNTKQKCYELNIDYGDYNFSKDLYNDKEYNKIITIDGEGNVESTTMETSKNFKGTRVKIFRSLVGNSYKKGNIKFLNSITNAIVNVSKANVDTSLLTPEKSYNISNPKANKAYDGKYILINKQEIFRKEDEKYFTVIVNLKLAKIVS